MTEKINMLITYITQRKGITTIFNSRSIDIETRNQPPIKLVIELFSDDNDKGYTQNNQEDRVKL